MHDLVLTALRCSGWLGTPVVKGRPPANPKMLSDAISSAQVQKSILLQQISMAHACLLHILLCARRALVKCCSVAYTMLQPLVLRMHEVLIK